MPILKSTHVSASKGELEYAYGQPHFSLPEQSPITAKLIGRTDRQYIQDQGEQELLRLPQNRSAGIQARWTANSHHRLITRTWKVVFSSCEDLICTIQELMEWGLVVLLGRAEQGMATLKQKRPPPNLCRD